MRYHCATVFLFYYPHNQKTGAEGLEPSTFGFGDQRSAN